MYVPRRRQGAGPGGGKQREAGAPRDGQQVPGPSSSAGLPGVLNGPGAPLPSPPLSGARRPAHNKFVEVSLPPPLQNLSMGASCPAALPAPLTDGPGAALLDGPVLAPRRLLLQLSQDFFHLAAPGIVA